MTAMTCRPAEKDLFHTSYSKSAGAIFTVQDPSGGRELNYMIVTVDGGPVDAFCYLHYSRVLAEYLNTWEFDHVVISAEIPEFLASGMAYHTNLDNIRVTAGTEMYDGGRYYRIKITPPDTDISTFMACLEEAAKRIKITDTITCSTRDLLTVLGINEQEKEKDYGMETCK